MSKIKPQKGLSITRFFTKKGQNPLENIPYELRTSRITNPDGSVVFEMKDVEVPVEWTQVATDILAQKYFRKKGVPDSKGGRNEKEWSAKQVVKRLAGTWRHWGEKYGYFATKEDSNAFENEMEHMLIRQMGAPNSPQWFNTGLAWAYGITGEAQGHYYVDPQTQKLMKSHDAYTRGQVHACFIQSIKDDLVNEGGIFDLMTREARLFKYGSGTGTNFSAIRGKHETLSGGGKSSGLMSFLQTIDRAAGAIKSGGTTRRAAKMVCLDIDHPEVEDFINWKVIEEQKVAALHAGSYICYEHLHRILTAALAKGLSPEENTELKGLIRDANAAHVPLNYIKRILMLAAQGMTLEEFNFKRYDTDFRSEAYLTVSGQNSNNSVRIPNEFLKAVEENRDWELKNRIDGKPCQKIPARKLWNDITYAAWACADPGVQYDTTINEWHTCPKDGSINASNPCVTGDTLVATAEGMRRISELVGTDVEIFDPFGEKQKTQGVFKTGNKPVFELKTKNGYRLKVTKDHLIFTDNRGFVPAGHLTKNDFIRLGPVGCFGSQSLEEKFAETLGLAIGDGCITNKEEMLFITLDKKETPIAESVNAYLLDYKNRFATDGRSARNTTVSQTPTTARVQTASQTIVEIMKKYAVLNKGSENKALTDAMYDLDKTTVAAVLRGLFTADGTVANYGEKSQYVSLDSSSLSLLQQVQLLLLQFGIKSKLYENRRSGNSFAWLPDGKGGIKEYSVKEMHSLRISRFSRKIFEEQIGFMEGTEKMNKLKTLNSNVSMYKDGFTDKFDSLTYLHDEDVFDLTEPTHHAFFANGLLVHNCSEYMFLDDTACNLASINLIKFYNPQTRQIDVEALEHASRLWTIVLEISVLMAQFPSEEIAQKSYEYRTLGLGYANLGTVLMQMGIPYSSEEAYAICGSLTAIMCGKSYATSAEMAKVLGPFPRYNTNKNSMLRVIKNHRRAAYGASKNEYDGLTVAPQGIAEKFCPDYLLRASRKCWDEALSEGKKHGYRNAQVTVIAPTGCLTGNSLISTNRGLVRLATLGNPHGEKWQETSFEVLTDVGPRVSTRFYINGVEQTRKIRTAAGYEIQGTLRHRIKVVDKITGDWRWKHFADIQPGDIVPLSLNQIFGAPQEIKLPGIGELHWNVSYGLTTPSLLTPELAELIGYFMGDGSRHAKGLRFCVFQEDHDVQDRLCNLIRTLFNIEPSITAKKGYTEIAIHSVPLTLWWETCGFSKKLPHTDHNGKGYTPYIPEAVLHSNDEKIYSAFLRGLFEADGTVTTGGPSWTTSSKEFSQEIQSLLLALGFPTSQKIDISGWGQSELFVLRLKNKSYHPLFAEKIGFLGNRKNKLVDLQNTDMPQSFKKDYIYLEPALISSLLPYIPEHHNAIQLALKRKGALSRKTALAMAEKISSEHLKKALCFFYDTVEANEDGGEQFTYDLSVPSNTTYIANGFISHNTIGLVMDCDTTGIEPDFALVKFKKLVGGGYFKIVNQSVAAALKALGYSTAKIKDIEAYLKGHFTLSGCPGINEKSLRERGFTDTELLAIETQLPSVFELRFALNRFVLGDDFCKNVLGFTDEMLADSNLDILKALGFTEEQIEKANEYVCGTLTLEGAPHLKEIHYPIFDCANKCGKKGTRFIPWIAHLRMMGAAQPFISGAISKTINMPEQSSLEDVAKAYHISWEYMLKAVALYRDGSKLSQPLNTSSQDPAYSTLFTFQEEESNETINSQDVQKALRSEAIRPIRHKLPAERHSITHKFTVANHEGYITIGLYEDSSPGEIFIKMSKEGSTLSGIMDAFALTISLCLQYGVPLEVLVAKFSHSRFEPSGMTGNRNIPLVKSIVDYIGRYLALKFLPKEVAKKYHNEELIDRAYSEANPLHLQKLPAETHFSAYPTNAPEGRILISPEDREQRPVGSAGSAVRTQAQLEKAQTNMVLSLGNEDAPMCGTCGIVMIRNGACYKCLECGETSGCS